MTIDIPLAVECPHCGGIKVLGQIGSGNTIGAELWSDGKQVAPMLSHSSPVQKCPHCGHYFLLSQVKNSYRSRDGAVSKNDWLSFQEALEANRDLQSLPPSQAETPIVITVWAYNDIYRNGQTPTPEQYAAFVEYVRQILVNPKITYRSLLFRAELCREIGQFHACLDTFYYFTPKNETETVIANSIRDKATREESTVYIIPF